MSGFSKREDGFETKFSLDQDMRFRAEARRDKLLAQWFGQKAGLSAEAITQYGQELIRDDLKQAGDADVAAKLAADLKAKGITVSASEIRAEMDRCFRAACDSLAAGE